MEIFAMCETTATLTPDTLKEHDDSRVPPLSKNNSTNKRLPILIIPGFMSSGLQVMQSNAKEAWVGKRIWINLKSLGFEAVHKSLHDDDNATPAAAAAVPSDDESKQHQGFTKEKKDDDDDADVEAQLMDDDDDDDDPKTPWLD